MDAITNLIIFTAIAIVLFVVLRHFVLWYWRLNEIVDTLNQILKELKSKGKDDEISH